jgi:hypothetical protein
LLLIVQLTEKTLSTANVRPAMKILGCEVASGGKPIGRKKRVMSASARAKISKATKARWAKFRATKAKGKR